MTETRKIMVIDDDVQMVETVKTLLESVGYQVSYAYQAEKGIELARQTKPDLILLDVMFASPPGPDGIEVSRRFHQDSELRGIPVIILTGIRKVLDYPFKISPDETWMPVKAFLEKPIKPDALLFEIAQVLAQATKET
jgi:two-component system alkaline phosphatase synthesis response regulator PhoP